MEFKVLTNVLPGEKCSRTPKT